MFSGHRPYAVAVSTKNSYEADDDDADEVFLVAEMREAWSMESRSDGIGGTTPWMPDPPTSSPWHALLIYRAALRLARLRLALSTDTVEVVFVEDETLTWSHGLKLGLVYRVRRHKAVLGRRWWSSSVHVE